MVAALVNILHRWRKVGAGRLEFLRLGEIASWLVSLMVHLSVLLVLALVTIWVPMQMPTPILVVPKSVDDEKLPQEFHFSATPDERPGATGSGGSLADARAAASVEADQSQVIYSLAPTAAITESPGLNIDHTLLEGPNISDNVPVKGAGSVGMSGASGAIDRLTNEILLSLDKRPTLVVWLFDQSGSLSAQRESIAKRFDHIYDELGIIAASGNSAFKQHLEKPLLTAVAEFGVGVKLLTPKPTDVLSEVKAAMRSVQDDAEGNGRENVFQSIRFLAEKFRSVRLATPQRNVMIVVFTDEAGDDPEFLDAAVDACRTYEMPVYVVGVPAPFGRETAFVKYVDPDPNFDQSPQPQDVHQGPESLLPERIKVLFGGKEQNEEQFDSGFGPFGLCRLAYETGGLYFTVHPNREVGRRIPPWETAAMSTYMTAFFDPRVMRNYRPDYGSAKQYRDILASNRACAALVQAAQLPWVTIENVQLRFPKVDDGQLARELSAAQREAARVTPEINQVVAVLRQGEKDREKLNKPRWQAGFDLAIGQALAFQVRAESYNALLAQAKQGMKFQNEKSDTWELRPASSVNVSSSLAKNAQAAKTYLERVVAENAGTPWALEAERELRIPLGWEWHEAFSNLAGRVAQAGNNPPRPQPAPAQPPPKPRRPPPKL